MVSQEMMSAMRECANRVDLWELTLVNNCLW